MLGEVCRAEQAFFLAAEVGDEDRALCGRFGETASDCEYGRRSAGVVIGAVADFGSVVGVECADRGATEVVEMGADHHVLVSELRVRARDEADEVLGRHLVGRPAAYWLGGGEPADVRRSAAGAAVGREVGGLEQAECGVATSEECSGAVVARRAGAAALELLRGERLDVAADHYRIRDRGASNEVGWAVATCAAGGGEQQRRDEGAANEDQFHGDGGYQAEVHCILPARWKRHQFRSPVPRDRRLRHAVLVRRDRPRIRCFRRRGAP